MNLGVRFFFLPCAVLTGFQLKANKPSLVGPIISLAFPVLIASFGSSYSWHKPPLCLFWNSSTCFLGARCRFSHAGCSLQDRVRDLEAEVTALSDLLTSHPIVPPFPPPIFLPPVSSASVIIPNSLPVTSPAPEQHDSVSHPDSQSKSDLI